MKIAAVVAGLALSSGLSIAGEPVDEQRPMAGNGIVRIENAFGSVTVRGWDREELAVTGTLGKEAEGLDVDGSEKSWDIEVVLPKRWRGDTEGSDLMVKIPRGARVQIAGVNTDLDVSDVDGRLKLNTVNGDIAVTGEPQVVRVETVNGQVEITGAASRVEVSAVSGDIELRGTTGEVSASSVSGDIRAVAEIFERVGFSSVSGDIEFRGAPVELGSVECESHSGKVTLVLPADISAEFDISTFSGDIENRFGPRAERTSEFAPGKALEFATGSGGAQISVSTFSGDIELLRE